jgi:AraC family transcriptional regulator of adaptative response / DNA-3-methyladenine glycosylase II
LSSLVARARALFDLDADAETIAEHLAADPFLRPLVLRFPGLRVLGAWDGFETAVRAILGQLVTVRAATTTAGKVAAAFGGTVDTGVAGLERLWPGPEALVDAALEEVGMTRAKATAIRSLAGAVVGGEVALDGSLPPTDLTAALVRLPGIGPWTADIVRMRVSRDPDAFVPGDLGVRRALAGVRVIDAEARSQAWRPWRAYAVMYLWRSIT